MSAQELSAPGHCVVRRDTTAFKQGEREKMTEESKLAPKRITVTLTIDLDDDQVADYLIERINANPLTRERGASPLSLDYATLDFLLDAVQPRHPQGRRAAEDVVVDAFEELYQAREWLRNLQLSAMSGATV